jgi:hypothetical protein
MHAVLQAHYQNCAAVCVHRIRTCQMCRCHNFRGLPQAVVSASSCQRKTKLKARIYCAAVRAMMSVIIQPSVIIINFPDSVSRTLQAWKRTCHPGLCTNRCTHSYAPSPVRLNEPIIA